MISRARVQVRHLQCSWLAHQRLHHANHNSAKRALSKNYPLVFVGLSWNSEAVFQISRPQPKAITYNNHQEGQVWWLACSLWGWSPLDFRLWWGLAGCGFGSFLWCVCGVKFHSIKEASLQTWTSNMSQQTVKIFLLVPFLVEKASHNSSKRALTKNFPLVFVGLSWHRGAIFQISRPQPKAITYNNHQEGQVWWLACSLWGWSPLDFRLWWGLAGCGFGSFLWCVCGVKFHSIKEASLQTWTSNMSQQTVKVYFCWCHFLLKKLATTVQNGHLPKTFLCLRLLGFLGTVKRFSKFPDHSQKQ